MGVTLSAPRPGTSGIWRLGLQGLLLQPGESELPRRTPPKPALFYALTYACPRSCAFCFNHAIPARRRHFNHDAFSHVVKEMAHFMDGDGQPLRLNLSGGEPLVHPRVGDLALEAATHGLDVALTTAGVNIKDTQLDQLEASGAQITLSFDCCDEVTYERTRGARTFRLARAALGQLEERGLLTRAIVVATRETEVFLEDTIRFLTNHGVGEVVVMEVTGGEALFGELGVRLSRDRLTRIQDDHPQVRIVLGHQCPVTLNVDPEGRYYVQDPKRETVAWLGQVGELSLASAFRRYADVAAQLPVQASEVLECRRERRS